MTNAPAVQAAPQVFDIASLGVLSAADVPVELEICKPKTTKGTGLLITLVGRDSEAYRALNRKLQNQRFAEMKKTRTLAMTAEQNEEEALRLLSACIVSWRCRKFEVQESQVVWLDEYVQTIHMSGEELACNIKNVERVLRQVPEIREQVEDFIQDRTNFLQGSQPTSSS